MLQDAQRAGKRLFGRWRRAAISVVALSLAYFAFPFPFHKSSAEDDIREAVIRGMVEGGRSLRGGNVRVCFVGVAPSFDWEEMGFTALDPPDAFLNRFCDFPVPVLPVSKSKYVGGIPSKVTDAGGQTGVVLATGSVRRLSLGIAVCQGVWYRANIAGSTGADTYFVRLPFVWIPVWTRTQFVS